MKKRVFFVPLLLCLGAWSQVSSFPEYIPEKIEETYYALFMYNYPRVTETSPNGYKEKVENLLYVKQEIQLNELITAPADPTRNNYEFRGWYLEESCTTRWNFETDKPQNSILLYAKWGTTHGEEYIEPEYVYPEKIVSDVNYRVTGILNKPVSNNEVNLATGAINRLIHNKDDVSFAINYERKADVTLKVATYDEESKIIHLEVSSGESFDIKVNDITPSLSIASENSGFETKAVKYEGWGAEYENYHVALAGSSSMENWETSKEDMNPIVSFNHGIGGTTVEQWTNKLFERLVMPYTPKIVTYYVGVNNIINSGDSGEVTGNKLEALFNKTHEYLPHAKIFYILINKLPGFRNLQDEFDIANQAALDYAASHDYLECVDAGVGLLKESGEPHFAYFRPDGLHMSRYGYVIWGAAVKKAIMDYLG